METPISVLFADVYADEADLNFEGNSHYLTAACGMTIFAVGEPSLELTAVSMASSLMKIWLRFGFLHTIVARKASVYLNVCAETADLLGINIHVLSRENHDPMIVECINRFLNSCLTIFCNDRGTTKVAQEGIFISLCAWKSAPVIGTDISRSMVVVSRKF